jgi:hypothetical protein
VEFPTQLRAATIAAAPREIADAIARLTVEIRRDVAVLLGKAFFASVDLRYALFIVDPAVVAIAGDDRAINAEPKIANDL